MPNRAALTDVSTGPAGAGRPGARDNSSRRGERFLPRVVGLEEEAEMQGSRRAQVITGPLAPFAAGFADELAGRGYSPSAIRLRLWLFGHLSRWLGGEGRAAGELTPERVERFVAARRAAGYKSWVSVRSVALPLEYLRGVGATPAATVRASGDRVEELLGDYRRYLRRERGLTESTAADYERVARLFVAARSARGGLDLERLRAGHVTAFVAGECAGRNVASAKHLVVALRSWLRYLHLSGLTVTALAEAVPAVAGRRGTSLPRGLDAGHVARLFASCDRRRAVGRRDYAILTLLVRLGLRAGEVAALALDDLDWHRGEITIRGKGDRRERLPLPTDVGEALVAYLRHGRPRAGVRSVFLRVNAPRGGLRAGGVRAVVHDACVRAGLAPVGAHRLRHTAATAMLRAGGSLPEVAQVLRHRRLDSTAIYAKVDRAALRGLAQPWPGGAA